MSLFWRNLFFTLLQPGIVAILVPYLLVRKELYGILHGTMGLMQYIGLVVWVAGIAITGHCIIRFATEGKGTLSPADPTQKLVITGLYRYSRNPMYVGVMMILIGELIFTQQLSLLYYAAIIFTAFTVFIVYWEEPRLRKDFGEAYDVYCRQVNRWI